MTGTSGGDRKTRDERRREARRRRVEAERRAARARRNRWLAGSLAALAVVGVAAFALTRPREPSAVETRAAALLASAEAQAAAAGCTDVREVGPYQPADLDQAHVGGDLIAAMPPLATYPSVPPASGPHADGTLPAGVYSTPPPMDLLLHSLEHGAAVVWYDPDAAGPALADLQDFYREPAVGSRVIVAPYDYPDEGEAGTLEPGVGMALVAWHHVQTCTEVNLAAAFGFTARYTAPPFRGEQYLGTAPEPGAPL
jgi:hypothetical protein